MPPYEPFDPSVRPVDLWSRSCRTRLSIPTFKKAELDDRRRQDGSPGHRLIPTKRDDRIPILLIKRQTGSNDDRATMFHGYTIIFPKGWAMALLPSFIYCGVKLAGVKEGQILHREAGIPSFPEHFGAVCRAGQRYEDDVAVEAERRWLKRPPGKRTDYATLKVDWPFKPDWTAVLLVCCSFVQEILLANLQEDFEHEEHDANDLREFRPWLLDQSLVPFLARLARSSDPARSLLSAVNTFRQRREMDPIPAGHRSAMLKACLCHVRVDVLGRGSPSDQAMIYKVDPAERSQWLQALDAVQASASSSHLEQVSAPHGSLLISSSARRDN